MHRACSCLSSYIYIYIYIMYMYLYTYLCIYASSSGNLRTMASCCTGCSGAVKVPNVGLTNDVCCVQAAAYHTYGWLARAQYPAELNPPTAITSLKLKTNPQLQHHPNTQRPKHHHLSTQQPKQHPRLTAPHHCPMAWWSCPHYSLPASSAPSYCCWWTGTRGRPTPGSRLQRAWAARTAWAVTQAWEARVVWTVRAGGS